MVTLLAPAPPPFTSKVTLLGLHPTTSRQADDGLHLLVPGGHQLLVLGQPSADQPLALVLPVDVQARLRWLTASSTFAIDRVLDPLTPAQRSRHRLALQAYDGRVDGASEREITSVLFDRDDLPRGAAWKADEVRAQTLRLIAGARRYVGGAYRRLLRLEPPGRRRR